MRLFLGRIGEKEEKTSARGDLAQCRSDKTKEDPSPGWTERFGVSGALIALVSTSLSRFRFFYPCPIRKVLLNPGRNLMVPKLAKKKRCPNAYHLPPIRSDRDLLQSKCPWVARIACRGSMRVQALKMPDQRERQCMAILEHFLGGLSVRRFPLVGVVASTLVQRHLSRLCNGLMPGMSLSMLPNTCLDPMHNVAWSRHSFFNCRPRCHRCCLLICTRDM